MITALKAMLVHCDKDGCKSADVFIGPSRERCLELADNADWDVRLSGHCYCKACRGSLGIRTSDHTPEDERR